MSTSTTHSARRPALAVLFLVSALVAALVLPSAASSTSRAHAPSFGTALRGAAAVGHGPSAVAIDPGTHTAYVANGQNPNGDPVGGNTVSVIDTRNCNAHLVHSCRGPWPTITVGHEPSALTVDRRTHTLYVTNIDDQTVSVVNGLTCNGQVTHGCGQTPATVPVGNAPDGIFADSRTGAVYVANFGDSTVSIIDGAACNGTHQAGCPTTAPAAFAVGDGPGDVDVNPMTHTAYVATFNGLSVFDTRTCNASAQSGCTQLGDFVICNGCFGSFSAKVDVAHNTIYEADGQTTVVALDGRSCNAEDLAGCAMAPHGTLALPDPGFDHILWFALDARLHTVYAVMQKNDTIIAIDTDDCNGRRRAACAAVEPRSVHVGTDPEGIGIDPETHTIYVVNQLDDNVSVVDTQRCNADTATGCRRRPPLLHVAPTGKITVDESTGTAYIPTRGTSITMVNIRACHAHHTDGCSRHWPHVVLGQHPNAIVVDRNTHTAYVAARGDGSEGSVTVLDTRTCSALNTDCSSVATIPIESGGPTSIDVNRRTHAVYVGATTPDGANTVSMIKGASCNATTTAGCEDPLAVMQDGPVRGPAIHCGGWAVDVAVNPVTNTVYATSTEGCGGIGDEVFVFDGATCGARNTSGCGAPTATIEAGHNPFEIAVDPRTNTIYAALLFDGEAHGRVAVIDGRLCNGTNTSGCGEPPPTAPAEFGSLGVAVDPAAGFVYAANIEDTSVSVIDGRRCNGTHTGGCHTHPRGIPVDDYPDEVAVAPSVLTAYVGSATRGTVSLIPLRRR